MTEELSPENLFLKGQIVNLLSFLATDLYFMLLVYLFAYFHNLKLVKTIIILRHNPSLG